MLLRWPDAPSASKYLGDTAKHIAACFKATTEEINKICPTSGEPTDPKITVVYEEKTYAFADEASRTKFNEVRENSLYQKLGGKAAIDAVGDAFYVRMLADERFKHIFDDVNMNKQRQKQKKFLSAAFGGPILWPGKALRTAHKALDLTDANFNAVAENLQKTESEACGKIVISMCAHCELA